MILFIGTDCQFPERRRDQAKKIIEDSMTSCTKILTKSNLPNCFIALKTLCNRLTGKTPDKFDLFETGSDFHNDLFQKNGFGGNWRDEKKQKIKNRCDQEIIKKYACGIIDSGYMRCLSEIDKRPCMKGLAEICKARKFVPENFSIKD